MEIVIAIAILGGLGLVFGLVLAAASKIFYVESDPRLDQLNECLPGANCGACGYSGCEGYAHAMVHEGAKVGLCSPGGAEVAKATSELLGVSGDVEYKTALIHCLGSYDFTTDKMEYDGIMSCAAAAQLAGGITSCRFGCMGLGDCMNACAYNAINICNGVAAINPDRCKGCSMCVKACPKGLISFVPLKNQAVVRCSNCDKGAATNKVCGIGCIGCTKCVRVCEFDAVKIVDSHAVVDPEKCTACGKCVEVCPRHVITMFQVKQPQ